MSEYTGSQAFCGLGTKVFVEGILINEVRNISIRPGKEVRIILNWIPDNESQAFLADLFVSQEVVSLACEAPGYGIVGPDKVRVSDLNIVITPHDVASMYVVFKVYDTADDGPEVDIILNELEIQDDAFEELLDNYFAKMRADAKREFEQW